MARHKHYNEIVAFAEGKEIQFKADTAWRDWRYPHCPSFYEYDEYRVKPKIIKREGWIALYRIDKNGFPTCCGVYGTEEEAREINGGRPVIKISWEEIEE